MCGHKELSCYNEGSFYLGLDMPSIIDELVSLRQTINQIAGWPDDGNVADIKRLAAKVIVDRIIENSEHTTGARLRGDAREVAQWQVRIREQTGTEVNQWMNVTHEGVATLQSKFAHVYEFRPLYE